MGMIESLTTVGILWAFNASAAVLGADLTIYNQGFAVVRETIPLDVVPGVNHITFARMTAHLEPDSVILRDPTGRRALHILEQNYRGDPVSPGLLLSLHEGKTIDFISYRADQVETIRGKVIRSAYEPHYSAMQRYGTAYAQTQRAYSRGQMSQPIIEVDGKIRFGLPGTPLFPSLTDDTILKPTIDWVIETDWVGTLDAELAYVTGGMSWEANYNIIAPENGDLVDIIGWVTIDNQSGKTFDQARIKLIAGDVAKLQAQDQLYPSLSRARELASGMRRPVSEKAFDEYHLYTLRRRTTLRDRQTKQVELLRGSGVRSKRLYIYDGAKLNLKQYRSWPATSTRSDREYGTQSNPKVWVMREFGNTVDNALGIPFPRGRMRFYRRDNDGQLEFTGEAIIDHTPRDETIRVFTGNAFDVVGQRRRTAYEISKTHDWLDESFEIKLRNHKKEPVEIRIVEHLYRWSNWEITEHSDAYAKIDTQTVEFRVTVAGDEEKTITYSVHYTW